MLLDVSQISSYVKLSQAVFVQNVNMTADNTTKVCLDLRAIKGDLYVGLEECNQRGLLNAGKWLTDLLLSLSHIKFSNNEVPGVPYNCGDELDIYYAAKSYFDSKEYDRCAYITKNCQESKIRFLHFYARYLANEKKRVENMTEAQTPPDPTKNAILKELYFELKKLYGAKVLDGFEIYLYGVVLKKLNLNEIAIHILLEAIHCSPLNWSAWAELSLLIPDKYRLKTLHLPNHWMQHFFIGHSYLDMLCNEEASDMFWDLQVNGFDKSHYLMAQTAISFHNGREVDRAIEMFKKIQILDPYRLDNLDIYSNLLYVKELKTELANLAHHAVKIDKYRVETCCIIGNYYSLRGDHHKAVLYFQRALKLNPYYLSAWTLMGHEFMELKNTNAAIHSYRQAIEVSRRDYRAWYGLGQTYELLKMPAYCVYYYKQAQQLRPTDSRMLIALGETYEKVDKTESALKCFYKACTVGDIEGIALMKLAKLYEKLGENTNAVAAYSKYCLDQPLAGDQTDLFHAYRYLANHHLRHGKLDEANDYACECLKHAETKEEGKSLLKAIAAKRSQTEIHTESIMEEAPAIITFPVRRAPLSPRSSNERALSPPL